MRKEQFITVKKYKNRKPISIEYLDVAFSFDIESTSFNTYKGKVISESEEMYIRIGMSYGLSLASIGLGLLPSDITIDFEK